MSAPNKSFFSGLHLAVTGFAAFVTAVAAIVGLAINQGWLSGNAKSGTGGAGTSVSTAAIPQYSVEPLALEFQPVGPSTASVKVTNTGVVPIAVENPTVTDASHFGASVQTCAGSVDPGRSCQLQVTFKRAPGTFNATLVIRVTGAPRATEVAIKATAIL
ncbi:MAG: Abnormal spindle-like microcephaly-assocd, ASPM-SPD-2-Hydin [Acidimicrobiaceae bacterium]|nr:Abnormal spindle-like microcephaly-assocd, ASPM-SPD-2-Hydin [Acidimicrobiaceae bacterium]